MALQDETLSPDVYYGLIEVQLNTYIGFFLDILIGCLISHNLLMLSHDVSRVVVHKGNDLALETFMCTTQNVDLTANFHSLFHLEFFVNALEVLASCG